MKITYCSTIVELISDVELYTRNIIVSDTMHSLGFGIYVLYLNYWWAMQKFMKISSPLHLPECCSSTCSSREPVCFLLWGDHCTALQCSILGSIRRTTWRWRLKKTNPKLWLVVSSTLWALCKRWPLLKSLRSGLVKQF